MKKSEAQAELKKIARELGDFDLYDAADSAEAAYSMLEAKMNDSDTPTIQISGKQLTNKSMFKKNQARRRDLIRFIGKDENEQFKELYQQELDILDAYGFMALAKCMSENV